jgi:hypothetical protein
MPTRLDHDPFVPFLESTTPMGIYVRTAVLGERTPELLETRREQIVRLKSAQLPNGSWRNRVVLTIQNLFALMLLGETEGTCGKRAVDWLLEDEVEGSRRRYANADSGFLSALHPADVKAIRARRDLIMNRGCAAAVKTGAALYFSAFFDLEGDPRVIQVFRAMDELFRKQRKKWCSFPCSNNILRAYVAHPLKKSSRTTKSALSRLGQLQTKSGNWKGVPDFYHAVNIVASSSLPSAVRQFERAHAYLHKTQNQDGTWGRKDREFKTFLALDAMIRQGYLTKRQGLKKYYEAQRKQRVEAPAPRRPKLKGSRPAENPLT